MKFEKVEEISERKEKWLVINFIKQTGARRRKQKA
jgi:hypothetical protein